MDGVRIKNILSLNFKEGEKVKISPIGKVVGADKRVFKIDGQTLLKALSKNALHIPLDINHSFGVAAGWFDYKSFEIKDDGIYASLELNKQGKEIVEDKLYRYLSPVFEINEQREVIGIDSVGLVNRPNLLNNALNQKGDNVDKEKNDEQKEAQNEDAKKIEQLQSELDAANKKIAVYEAKEKEQDSKQDEQKLEENSQKKEISELKLQLFEINQKLAVFGKSGLEKNAREDLNDEDKRVAQMLGLSEDEYRGGK